MPHSGLGTVSADGALVGIQINKTSAFQGDPGLIVKTNEQLQSRVDSARTGAHSCGIREGFSGSVTSSLTAVDGLCITGAASAKA